MATREADSEAIQVESCVYDLAQLKSRWGAVVTFPNLRIDFIRHGETTNNQRELVSGASDVELTSKGRLQATRLGGMLGEQYGIVLCSALSRARETLELALQAARMPLGYTIDARLNERSLGVLQGKPAVHIPQFARGDLDYAPQGGESYRSVYARCLSVLWDLSHDDRVADRESVLVSTHMGPLRVFVAVLAHLPSAAHMTALRFGNSELLSLRLSHVHWPQYL